MTIGIDPRTILYPWSLELRTRSLSWWVSLRHMDMLGKHLNQTSPLATLVWTALMRESSKFRCLPSLRQSSIVVFNPNLVMGIAATWIHPRCRKLYLSLNLPMSFSERRMNSSCSGFTLIKLSLVFITYLVLLKN